MSFSEYRAAGNTNDPKLRLEQLEKSVQKYGYNVPNIDGYEQFGTRFGTDFIRDNLSIFPKLKGCLLYTSPSPRDGLLSRMPSSA